MTYVQYCTMSQKVHKLQNRVITQRPSVQIQEPVENILDLDHNKDPLVYNTWNQSENSAK